MESRGNKKRKKPDIGELSEFFESWEKRRLDDVRAFQELVGKYPEICPFEHFAVIYNSNKFARQKSEDILKIQKQREIKKEVEPDVKKCIPSKYNDEKKGVAIQERPFEAKKPITISKTEESSSLNRNEEPTMEKEGISELLQIRKSKIQSTKPVLPKYIDTFIKWYRQGCIDKIRANTFYEESGPHKKERSYGEINDNVSGNMGNLRQDFKDYYETEGKHSEFEVYFIAERGNYLLGVKRRIKEHTASESVSLAESMEPRGDVHDRDAFNIGHNNELDRVSRLLKKSPKMA